MYVQTFNFGKVPIEMWEYPVMFALLALVYLIGQRIRKKNIKAYPEFRYFIPGLFIKVGGGFFFACIYVFYYGQGDTTSFYECSMAFTRLLLHDVGDFMTVLFGNGTQEMKSYFTSQTGEPLMYMFAESSTRFTIKILVPFVLISGQSYFITTFFVSIFTYGGLWGLYRMFVSYYPSYSRELAYAILFMPSVAFWGSGILKDSFTLAATTYLIVRINAVIKRKGSLWLNVVAIIVFSYIIISIKAYVMLIIMPSALVWLMYSRISKITNSLIKYLVLPLVVLFIVVGSYFGLRAFGESLGKFSVEHALKTAAINQNDLKQEYYEGNSFDIGDFEPTVAGALSKSPQATAAGLFRPFLWESRNIVMLLSALENSIILGFTLWILIKIKLRRITKYLGKHPLIIYCLVFSIMFAFMIGLTSPNFGALVRFKVPLIPLYMASLMILYLELKPGKNWEKTNQARYRQPWTN